MKNSSIIQGIGGYRLAVELRHRSWSDDENTTQFLKRNNAARVQIIELPIQVPLEDDEVNKTCNS